MSKTVENAVQPNYVSAKYAREVLDVTDETLRRWADSGKINSIRTPGNHRLYDVQTYLQSVLQKDSKSVSQTGAFFNFSDTNETEFIQLATFEQTSDENRKLTMEDYLYHKIRINPNGQLNITPDKYLSEPISQAPSVSIIKPINLKNLSGGSNTVDFALSRISDGCRNLSLIGPIDKIEKIELCILQTPLKKTEEEEKIMLFLPEEIESRKKKEEQYKNPYFLNNVGEVKYESLDIIETIDKTMFHIFETMFGWNKDKQYNMLPTFLQRSNGILFCQSLYSRLVLRLYTTNETDKHLFSLAAHTVYLSTQARGVCGKNPFKMGYETCRFLTSKLLDVNECNKIVIPELPKIKHQLSDEATTALFVSIWNKTKQKFDLSSLQSFSFVLDTTVYRSFTFVNNLDELYHNQLMTCGKTGEHIIIPFSSSVLKTPYKVSGHFKLGRITDPHLLVEFKPSDTLDEFEIQIHSTALTMLDFKSGFIFVN